MSEIKRYATRVADGGVVGMIEDEDGGWVMYTDHVAALKAARNELPDVGSWSPEPNGSKYTSPRAAQE